MSAKSLVSATLASALLAPAAMGNEVNLGVKTFHSNLEVHSGNVDTVFMDEKSSEEGESGYENSPGFGITAEVGLGSFSVGGDLSYAKYHSSVDSSMTSTSLNAHGRYYIPAGLEIKPYGIGMVGYERFESKVDMEGGSLSYDPASLFNLGFGVGAKYEISKKLGVDFQLSHMRTIVKGDSDLSGSYVGLGLDGEEGVFDIKGKINDIETVKTEASIAMTFSI